MALLMAQLKPHLTPGPLLEGDLTSPLLHGDVRRTSPEVYAVDSDSPGIEFQAFMSSQLAYGLETPSPSPTRLMESPSREPLGGVALSDPKGKDLNVASIEQALIPDRYVDRDQDQDQDSGLPFEVNKQGASFRTEVLSLSPLNAGTRPGAYTYEAPIGSYPEQCLTLSLVGGSAGVSSQRGGMGRTTEGGRAPHQQSSIPLVAPWQRWLRDGCFLP